MKTIYTLVKENYIRGDFEGNGTTLLQSDNLEDCQATLDNLLRNENVVDCPSDDTSYDCYYIDAYEVDEDGDVVGWSETSIQIFVESKYWNGKRL